MIGCKGPPCLTAHLNLVYGESRTVMRGQAGGVRKKSKRPSTKKSKRAASSRKKSKTTKKRTASTAKKPKLSAKQRAALAKGRAKRKANLAKKGK